MTKFSEITKKAIGKNKNIVISRTSDGFISIAQQIIANSFGQELAMFCKNSIVVDEEGLENVSEAIIDALEKISNDKKKK
ncbi:MAG TPA: hypothetical protein VMZ91_10410 [Candidatus Paceibacterota bacterium]|nr:hypothetical protein [Candidatus Paceibacterota bacterium]